MSFETIVTSELNSGSFKRGINIDDPTAWGALDSFDTGSYVTLDGLGTLPINYSMDDMSMNKGSHFHNMAIVNNVLYPKPFKQKHSDFMRGEQLYKILIYRKDLHHQDGLTDESFLVAKKKQIPIFDIDTFNYIQAVTEKKPHSLDHAVSAESFLKDWGIAGPVVSEEGQDEWMTNQNTTKKPQRLYNVTQWGYCAAENIWGQDLLKHPQTSLWLILKKVRSKKSYPVDGFRHEVHVKNALVENGKYLAEEDSEGEDYPEDGEPITSTPFQFVPWCSHIFGKPLPRDLEYIDEFGIKRLGVGIYLGQYHNSGGTSDIRSFDGRNMYPSNLKPSSNRQVIWIVWNPGY